MRIRAFHLVAPGLVLIPALTALAGGWAVITVEDLPDYIVAGRPVTLAFTVRQHGVRPLDGLRPTVEARAGSLSAPAAATPGKGTGRYAATLTLPRAGEWTITIHSGFGNSATTLEPIRVVMPGSESSIALSDAERGRRLFVAKGCVTCHVQNRVGPDLTGTRYDAGYLRRFLADPSSVVSVPQGSFQMPNLGLRQPEITALVAFINTERQVGAR